MKEKRCFCGLKFNNIIHYERHNNKCNVKLEDKFNNLNLYIYSLIHKSILLQKKIKSIN